ncbi:MAG TPA: hypothetical protein VJP77_09015, partial [Planctomycetota bacterium]|nr:hypothetical protein [Planctomycetota bacterium]
MQILRQRTLASPRAGSALLASLLVATVVALLTAGMMQLSAANWGRSRAAVEAKKAFYVAEAGIAEGIYSLTTGGTGNVATAEAPARFGEGLFWVDAVENEYGLVVLESTALCKQARTKVSVVLQREAHPLGSLGFFGEQGLNLGAGASIDAYNSSEDAGLIGGLLGGLLGGGPPPARIGSNGDVQVGDGAIVDGDATPGTTGGVQLGVDA